MREPLTALNARRRHPVTGKVRCDLIKQALNERPELPICPCPFTSRMRRNALVEMRPGNRESVAAKPQVNLIIRLRQIKDFRQRAPQFTTIDCETVPCQCTFQSGVFPPELFDLEQMPYRSFIFIENFRCMAPSDGGVHQRRND